MLERAIRMPLASVLKLAHSFKKFGAKFCSTYAQNIELKRKVEPP